MTIHTGTKERSYLCIQLTSGVIVSNTICEVPTVAMSERNHNECGVNRPDLCTPPSFS